MRRGGVSWVLLPAAVLGCGGGDAPPAPAGPSQPEPGRDAGPPHDGAARPDATVPRDAHPSPRPADGGPVLPAADVEVELPFGGERVADRIPVDASPGRLDVHFSVDTTGSFGEEIDVLQSRLEDGIVDALDDRVDDVAFGVSRFEDFPVTPYGRPGDTPFELLTAVTTSDPRLADAMARLDSPLGSGGDGPESGAEALWQIATGEGLVTDDRIWIAPFEEAAPGGGELGGVGFRERALHAVVHITDAPSHGPSDYEDPVPPTHELEAAIEALASIDARVLGIATRAPQDGPNARAHLERLARATGAVTAPTDGACPTGIDGRRRTPAGGLCPLVFDVRADGSGLSETVVEALTDLLDTIRYEEVYGHVPRDRLDFVRAVEAVDADPDTDGTDPSTADRRPPDDGFADTFVDVRSGTSLTFAIRLRNDRLPAAIHEQVFRIPVEIHGDGRVLERRVVRVRVPARTPDAGAADAGS